MKVTQEKNKEWVEFLLNKVIIWNNVLTSIAIEGIYIKIMAYVSIVDLSM